MTIGELLGAPQAQTPLLAVIAAGLLTVARVIGKRAAASMQRQGARLGALETAHNSEQTRRRQLEECLRAAGFPLPYWPDDPPELYRPPPPRYRYDDEDQADDGRRYSQPELDAMTAEQRRPVPAPPAHRR